MNIVLRERRMTRQEFFPWAEAQDRRYEFDGFQPVAMTGGSLNHSRITLNLQAALRSRLRGSGCEAFGPDAGVSTVGEAVRYPDAVVSCSKVPGSELLLPGAVVVFEVVSPTSGRVDRIIKLQEYHAVPTIRRYVILEQASIGLTVHVRPSALEPWTTHSLIAGDILGMPEIGIDVPVAEFYENCGLEAADGA